MLKSLKFNEAFPTLKGALDGSISFRCAAYRFLRYDRKMTMNYSESEEKENLDETTVGWRTAGLEHDTRSISLITNIQ